MDSITIRHPITLKAVVTEEFKANTVAELEEAIRELDAELSSIDFDTRRIIADLERQNLKQAMEFKRQIEVERNRRLDLKKTMEDKMVEVRAWQLDDEVVQGRIEGVAQVKVGDDLNKVMNATIVVKNGLVVKITNE
jgi:hypothetical protein